MKTGLMEPAKALGALAEIKQGQLRGGEPLAPGSLNAAREVLAETGLFMQAKECVKHEVHAAADDFEPMLIEGHLEGSIIEVPMPSGETWRYTKPHTFAAPCPVLVCLHSKATALVFRPSAEGVHPFLGIARRFGVDAAKKGGAE